MVFQGEAWIGGRVRKVTTVLIVLAMAAAACGDSAEPAAQPVTTAPAQVGSTTTATTTIAATTVTTTTPAATPAAPPGSSTTTTGEIARGPLRFDFTVVRGEEQPALPDGEGDDWDSTWTFAPNVVFHDGTFHMFYSGWGADSIGIGYATSPDGVEFQRVGDGPVVRLAPEDRDLEAGRAVVRVRSDGT